MSLPIRTNKQFFAALFKKGVDAIPEADDSTAMGELLNHVKRETSKELSGAATSEDSNGTIETEGHEV